MGISWKEWEGGVIERGTTTLNESVWMKNLSQSGHPTSLYTPLLPSAPPLSHSMMRDYHRHQSPIKNHSSMISLSVITTASTPHRFQAFTIKTDITLEDKCLPQK